MASPRKSNPQVSKLIQDLKALAREQEAPVWRAVAERLERPLRNWAEVNLSRLDRYAVGDAPVVVPGKLLGSGEVHKPLTVAAFHSSASARRKVEGAGGRVLPIADLARENPKGKGVRIMG